MKEIRVMLVTKLKGMSLVMIFIFTFEAALTQKNPLMNEFFIKILVDSTTRFCGSFLEKMEWQKWSNKTIVNLPSGLINELLFYYSLFL